VSAFVMISIVWPVSCSSTHGAPPPPTKPFVKVSGHVPPCPMDSERHCDTDDSRTLSFIYNSQHIHTDIQKYSLEFKTKK